jgi:hypothetical protein
MKKLPILLTFILSNSFCFSQNYQAEKFQAAMMQKKDGALIVYTGQKHSFTIDIIADSVKPSDQPNFLIADGKIIQSKIIPFKTKLDFDNLSEEAQKKNLLGYMDYEMDYIKEQLKSKKLNESNEFINLNNKIFLFWTYDMPKNYPTIAKQCYFVTICFDQILILNSPVDKVKTLEEVKGFLINIGKTLKQNDKIIDLNKLYYELKEK